MQHIIYASFLSNILNILCCVLIFFLTQSWITTAICAILFLLILDGNIIVDLFFPLTVLIYALINFHFHWSFGVIGGVWIIMVALIIYGFSKDKG